MSRPRWVLAAALVSVVAVLQLVRAVAGWQVIVNGFSVPIWLSYIASVLLAIFAILLWKDLR